MKSFSRAIIFAIASLCASCKPSADTNSAEKAAIAAEKAAIAAEKASVSKDVLTFLQNTKFFVGVFGGDSDIRITSTWGYSDFEYNSDDETLALTSMDVTIIKGRGIPVSVSPCLKKYRIDLKTVNPVIEMRARTKSLVYTVSEPLVDISIKANYQTRQIKKEGSEESILFTQNEKNSLELMPWTSENKAAITFTVTPELGARLKKALEDLIRVNGVAVSKY